MNDDQLQKLRISSEQKRRSSTPVWLIILIVFGITGVVAFFAVPRASDSVRSGLKSGGDSSKSKPMGFGTNTSSSGSASGSSTAGKAASSNSAGTGSTSPSSTSSGDSLLTVSGYIIARERIEISPRFMGVVRWIGVKKGDAVTNGQVVVLLDDSEYRARLAESDGQLAVAKVALDRAKVDFRRATELVAQRVEMEKTLDDAKLSVAAAEAQLKQVEGARKLTETWIEWCTIRSPVNGVVLEKLVDANELVSPQTFGGTRGPSTSLLAVADLADLQVEIDVNEADLAKISLGQPCRISPEAYSAKVYEGVVAEIAPEANRSKGTLQIKVQVKNPDRFLTPELSAKVVFLDPKKQAAN